MFNENDTNVYVSWLIGLLTENLATPLLNPGAHNGNVIAYDAAAGVFWVM